jgi:hypothetical protein
MRRSLFLFIPFVTADPCTDLCNDDGPQICTKGSWTKANGYCQNYLCRSDPANGDVCYHTAETAANCPSTGTGVKASDVQHILGVLQALHHRVYGWAIALQTHRSGS